MSSRSRTKRIPNTQTHPKSPRVLACVFCQQRKVKCDRRSPCSNCIKHRTHCVPATQTRRKRRFPERQLLDRLRKYEDLLRRHNVTFDPLHRTESDESRASYGSEDDRPGSETLSRSTSESPYEARCALTFLFLDYLNAGRTNSPFPRNIYCAMKHGV